MKRRTTTRWIILALLPVLVLSVLSFRPQDDSSVERLVKGLDADSIEARADASARLLEIGKTAIPTLLARQKEGSIELKARIVQLIQKIEERERLRAVFPPETLVTLGAKDIPLRQVLDEVSKRVLTPIDIAEVSADTRVTISLAKVPFWQALDEICKASGQIMWDVRGEKVVVKMEKYRELPKCISGPFAIFVKEIQPPTAPPPGGRTKAHLPVAHIVTSWEKGVKPESIRFLLLEAQDDQGTALMGNGGGSSAISMGFGEALSIPWRMAFAAPYAPGATKLTTMKFEVTFRFVLSYETLSLDTSDARIGLKIGSEDFSATLRKFTRVGAAMTAEVELSSSNRKPDAFQAESHHAFTLKDKDGKDYNGMISKCISRSDGITLEILFGLPATGQPNGLTVRFPKEIHHEKVDLDLKDVPIRR
jgi:hypothetical protein